MVFHALTFARLRRKLFELVVDRPSAQTSPEEPARQLSVDIRK